MTTNVPTPITIPNKLTPNVPEANQFPRKIDDLAQPRNKPAETLVPNQPNTAGKFGRRIDVNPPQIAPQNVPAPNPAPVINKPLVPETKQLPPRVETQQPKRFNRYALSHHRF